MKRKQYIAPTATILAMDTENLCDMNLTSNPAVHNVNNNDYQGDGGDSWDNWDNLSKGNNNLTYNQFELWEDEEEY